MTYEPQSLLASYGRGQLDLASLVTALKAQPEPTFAERSTDEATSWMEAADLPVRDGDILPVILERAVARGSITREQSHEIYRAAVT